MVRVVGPTGRLLSHTDRRTAALVVRRKRAIWLNVDKIQMFMTKEDRRDFYRQVIAESNNWCQLCNGRLCGGHIPPNEATVDHIVPLSKGGTDLRSNLLCASKSCNGLKRNLTLDEFQQRYLKEASDGDAQ